MTDKLPKYEVIEKREHPEIFELLRELVANFHTPELADAKIALAWINDVKADADGHTLWGRAKKVGELERQFHAHDFVIQLNKFVWGELPPLARRALLDHELSHCGSKEDEKTGEATFVTHKHDVEEFVHIVRRYGLWKQDVEALVNAALKREQKTMFDKTGAVDEAAEELRDAVAGMPGVESVTLSMGEKSVTLTGGAKSAKNGG